MVKLTQSMAHWLFSYHKDVASLIALGHLELLTEEMVDEYVEWCMTEEGMSYLEGGSNYVPRK